TPTRTGRSTFARPSGSRYRPPRRPRRSTSPGRSPARASRRAVGRSVAAAAGAAAAGRAGAAAGARERGRPAAGALADRGEERQEAAGACRAAGRAGDVVRGGLEAQQTFEPAVAGPAGKLVQRHGRGLLRLSLAIVVSLAARVLDLLLPPRCAGCGERESWLCTACAVGLPRLDGPRCRVCAVALAGGGSLCADCHRAPPPPELVRAAYRHEGLARRLVLDLKYRRHRHLAPTLGALLAASVPRDVDALVPVPLHPRRRRERGFNQSELLAGELARRLR